MYQASKVASRFCLQHTACLLSNLVGVCSPFPTWGLLPLMGVALLLQGAHKDAVRGVRWLGPTARIVSFTSEKVAHGYRNTLLLTDIRNRSSFAFREVGAEGAPLKGIRASPLGRYIIILFGGAPAEIWAVGHPTCDTTFAPRPPTPLSLLHPSYPLPLRLTYLVLPQFFHFIRTTDTHC